MDPALGSAFPVAAAAVVIACVMLLSWLLARHAGRGERRRRRVRAAEMFRMLGDRLAGKVPPETLRGATADMASDPFWEALEAIALTLRLRERRELARALAGSEHVLAERRALRDDSLERRTLAARRLASVPSRGARRALRRTLVTGPAAASFAAARALARHRDIAALRWLLGHASCLGPRDGRALSALLRGYGRAAAAPMIAALERGGSEPALEAALVETLGLTRSFSARTAIEHRLRAPATDVRIAAARALGRLGMGESIPALMLALDDPAWAVRAQAARALGRLHATPAIDALADRVADRAWWVRRHAAYALATLDGEGRDALCGIIAHSSDRYAREMAREALDQISERRPA